MQHRLLMLTALAALAVALLAGCPRLAPEPEPPAAEEPAEQPTPEEAGGRLVEDAAPAPPASGAAVAQAAADDHVVLSREQLEASVVVHGSWGSEEGQFGAIPGEGTYGPALYDVNLSGAIVVWDDCGNRRVQAFDRDGGLLGTVDVPVPGIIAMTAGLAHEVFLTDGNIVLRADWQKGEYEHLGELPREFGGASGITAAWYAPGPAGGRTWRLFLQQRLPTLEYGQLWIQAYTTDLTRVGGTPGFSPFAVVEPFGLYGIEQTAVHEDRGVVTLIRWNASERLVRRTECVLPVRLPEKGGCRIIGVHHYPRNVCLLTYDAATVQPNRVFVIAPSGAICGEMCIPQDIPPASVTHPDDRFRADAVGNLYVSWADPVKGYSISRVPLPTE